MLGTNPVNKDKFILRDYIWWKQQVGNTDFLTWLIYPPCGLVPMSTWKIPYRFFFSVWNRASRVDFSDLVKYFQIWPCFCVHEKIIILSILGPAKVSRPLVITKVGAGSEKTLKNWIGHSGRPKMRRMNFWPVLRRNLKFFWFYWPNH